MQPEDRPFLHNTDQRHAVLHVPCPVQAAGLLHRGHRCEAGPVHLPDQLELPSSGSPDGALRGDGLPSQVQSLGLCHSDCYHYAMGCGKHYAFCTCSYITIVLLDNTVLIVYKFMSMC